MSAPDVLVAILAAGASRRLGRSKQLVALAGEPLLRRQCRCALAAAVGPVQVILGCDADQHVRAIADLPVEIAVNVEWREGMASTLRHAVASASERRAALLVLPCDHYLVTPDDLRALYDTWRDSPSVVCASRWDQYVGPPAILPAECHDQIRRLRGDAGARSILFDPQRPRPIEVANPRAIYDIDSPADIDLAQSLVPAHESRA